MKDQDSTCLKGFDGHKTFTNVSVVEKAEFSESTEQFQSTVISTSESSPTRAYLSTGVSILVIIQLVGITFITSFSNGILAVGLPTIAEDVELQQNMLLWPSSVGYLATGMFLLLAGAVSDVAGPKLINLIGCVSLAASTLAVGLSRNGVELILFRAWQGLAFGLAYPSSTSIISLHVRSGPPRNVGFACIGFAMVFGFAGGLFRTLRRSRCWSCPAHSWCFSSAF